MSVPPFAWLIRATASRHGTRNGRALARLGDAEGPILKSTMREACTPTVPGWRSTAADYQSSSRRAHGSSCGPSKVTPLDMRHDRRNSRRYAPASASRREALPLTAPRATRHSRSGWTAKAAAGGHRAQERRGRLRGRPLRQRHPGDGSAAAAQRLYRAIGGRQLTNRGLTKA